MIINAIITNPRCLDELELEKLGIKSWLPNHETKGSVCTDFRSAEDLVLNPSEVKAIRTGLIVEIPDGFELAARPRSGIFLRNSCFVIGTIDSDYRGEIRVLMMNAGCKPFQIKFGDRIAQFKLSQYFKQEFNLVSELSSTERGAGGFGSTGI